MSRETNEISSISESLGAQRPRRGFVKGLLTTMGVLGGVAVGGVRVWQVTPARAKDVSPLNKQKAIQTILDIAVTAERLAVTTYHNALKNASLLGLSSNDVKNLRAAMLEEQIHEQFFASQGGFPLTSIFSYPDGKKTFSDLPTFIKAQQQLEGVFDSAFLAAVKEFAVLGEPRLAQIAAQIAAIEAEHRALGRSIGGLSPVTNWAYAPIFLKTVADAPEVAADAGYLSPKAGNSYPYEPVSTLSAGIEYRTPFTV